MHGMTDAMVGRLRQMEEQLLQVSDDAAEGADGVFVVDALRAEMQRLEASVSELASGKRHACLLYTSPSTRDRTRSRLPSSA